MGVMISFGLLFGGLEKVGVDKSLVIPIFSINNETSCQIKSLGFDLAADGFFVGFHRFL
jgi:hypothetical protein